MPPAATPAHDLPTRAVRCRRYLHTNPIAALRVRPPPITDRVWAMAAMYGAFALVVGLSSGTLEPGRPSLLEALVRPIGLLLFPAFIEEFVFRGVLLPRSLSLRPWLHQAAAVLASTLLFVAYHPLNHYLIGLSDTSLFVEPAFLVIVTALGLTCAVGYLRTGSLWVPILVHWATVVLWNLFLGRP